MSILSSQSLGIHFRSQCCYRVFKTSHRGGGGRRGEGRGSVVDLGVLLFAEFNEDRNTSGEPVAQHRGVQVGSLHHCFHPSND